MEYASYIPLRTDASNEGISSISHSPLHIPLNFIILFRKVAESGIIVWDCKYEEVIFCPYALLFASDDPRHRAMPV
jgi:hypothetical protein